MYASRANDEANAADAFFSNLLERHQQQHGRRPHQVRVQRREQPAREDGVLDWVLVPPGYRHASYRVVPSQLSDHLPVVTDVARLPAPGTP